MANEQYYEKVAGDDSNDAPSRSRAFRAPPTAAKKRTTLTKVAIGAVVATVFIAAVGLVSQAIVSYKLPSAIITALEQNNGTLAADADANKASAGMTMGDDADPVGGAETSKSESNTVAGSETFVAPFAGAKHQEMRTCGSTADEARAAGCVFDVMMQLWTPPECMDTALSERYLAASNWTWYANSDASRAYTDEEIRKGDHDVVYVAQSYHRHHCIFAWERLTRAMRNQAPLIEELISYDHVMHCRHKTLTLPEEGAESVRGVVAPTGFTRCASYDVWIKNLPLNKMSSID